MGRLFGMGGRRRIGPWCLIAVALAAPAAHAGEPPGTRGSSACNRLVVSLVDRIARSPMTELQARIQADRVTRNVLDPLSQQLPSGAQWREGDPFWEEAYAIVNPEVLGHLRSTMAEIHRYQQGNLPQRLDPATCEKHLALLQSKLGSIAQRVQFAFEAEYFLGALQKAFPIPSRLQPWVVKMQEDIRADKALENDPHVRRQPAAWAKAREEVRAYGLRLADAGKALGNGRSAEQDRASREAGAQMAARRRADILDVMRRFREAHGS